jgi:hypothetical protein
MCEEGPIVIKKRRKRNLIPSWDMPSDPIKAVFWFMFWLLKVLVSFFWIPIIIMAGIETFFNWSSAGGGAAAGVVAGIVTVLVGLAIWGILYVVTLFLNVGSTVSHVISDVNRAQRGFSSRRPLYPFNDSEAEKNVVEGTITDLQEERRKRRPD